MLHSDIDVRAARASDLAGVLALYRHLNPDDAPMSEERARAIWQRMLDQPDFRCVVVVCESTLVASCCVAVLPNLTRGGRSYALIENVVTHADHRRRGFGRMVLAEALRHSWDAGCYKAMLLTGSRRPETHHFYESCGFRSDDKTGFVARPS